MSITDGLLVNATNSNAAFASRTAAQTIAGSKTFTDDVILNGKFRSDLLVDSTTTGSNATLAQPTKYAVALTNASLVSIAGITQPASGSQYFILYNNTGAAFTIVNSNAAADDILTGTGSNLTVAQNATVHFAYDTNFSRWRVVGGSGSGGGESVQEVPSGTIDGVNDTFTLSFTPVYAQSVLVYVNGIKRLYTTHYTVSGTTLTFTAGNIPATAQSVEVSYIK